MESVQSEKELFGQIALSCNYITTEQLIECLNYRRKQASKKQIGEILMERGYIDVEQISNVLVIQKKNLERQINHIKRKRRDVLFGKLCIENNFLKHDDIIRAMIKQEEIERKGDYTTLGRILFDQGLLKQREITSVLVEQRKNIFFCVSCQKEINLHSNDYSPSPLCPDCYSLTE